MFFCQRYNVPSQQKWIVRIIFMIPIYAVASWLSMRYYHYSLYFDAFRGIYEGAGAPGAIRCRGAHYALAFG